MIRDNREKYDKLREELFQRSGNTLNVGIGPKKGYELYENGMSVLEVAILNEFKSYSGGPPRSWLGNWFDENQAQVKRWLVEQYELVVKGEKTQAQALDAVGQKCVTSIRERIRAKIPPPNAAITVKRKGSSIPLIATGMFMKAIGYLKVRGKPKQ